MDYKAAFLAGQDAAKRAEAARKEIRGVIADISKQILDATDGKARVTLAKFEKPLQFPVVAILGKREKYTALAAQNPLAKDQTFTELALWDEDPGGYPCRLTWEGVDQTCRDKEALEACLASMLENATVGEKLLKVMNLPIQPGPAPETKTLSNN